MLWCHVTLITKEEKQNIGERVMMKAPRTACLMVVLCITTVLLEARRSIHRTPEATPEITVYWRDDQTEKYRLRDSHLEEGAVFHTFDREYFESHMLPSGVIPYRYEPKKSIETSVLKKLLEELVCEMQAGKTVFTHFEPLKKNEFNTHSRTGFIVVKFKDYPFVAKVFVEEPSSFVDPYSRGFRPMCIYFMSGGVMRHSTGFGRIPNLDIIRKHVADDPCWDALITMPDKWFWQPDNVRQLVVEGKNIGPNPSMKVTLPSVYAIVADLIIPEKRMSLISKKDARLCLDLCHYCDYCIDPNISNFVLERNIEPRTKKYTVPIPDNANNHQRMVANYMQELLDDDLSLCIYDTEHFRTLVGIKDAPFHTSNYVSWYLKLSKKFMRDKFFKFKYERIEAQKHPTFQYLF